MPYTVTQGDILSVGADAVVLSLEMSMRVAEGPTNARLVSVGGDRLRTALKGIRFVPVGSAAAAGDCGLPVRQVLVTAIPRWLTGKANELLALRRCYQSLFSLAEDLGCARLACPFLSAQYYRFPKEEAVHVALTEAEKAGIPISFFTDTPELFALSGTHYCPPRIVSYVGWYRDHALFELDNGLFARVDLRPEIREVSVIPYFEACFRVGNNPLQTPLPETEIARLRRIVEESW